MRVWLTGESRVLLDRGESSLLTCTYIDKDNLTRGGKISVDQVFSSEIADEMGTYWWIPAPSEQPYRRLSAYLQIPVVL